MRIIPNEDTRSQEKVSDPKDTTDENTISKDEDMRISPLEQTIADLLVKQVAHERFNASLYITMSNFYNVKGYVKLGTYYENRAQEEIQHSKWIEEYLFDSDIIFNFPQIDKVDIKLVELIDSFQLTVDKENDTTKAINNIASEAMKINDFQTFEFLQKLIKEQVEEMSISRTILAIANSDSDWLIKEKAILDFYSK